MCGLFGVINSNINNCSLFQNSLDKISHRDPDNNNLFDKDGVSFGSKRLSIRDLSEVANSPLFNEKKI